MGCLTPSATLAITAAAKALKAQGVDVCSMSAGEPDFDTPEVIKQAAIQALQEGKTGYTPASGIPELKKAIAEKFQKDNGIKTTPAQIIIAPGAKYSVFTAVAALCGPGDEVIIPAPFWLSYTEMVKAAGATPVIVQTTAENNYEILPEELEAAVNENTRLMILTTPSNPTGAVYRKATLEKIAEIAVKNNFMVLADEIYEKLVYDADKPHISIASLNDEINALTITVNGFSKAYAMTGWRLGYLSAPLWLAKKINAFQSHSTSNPTTFAQYGGLKALEAADEAVEEMRQAFSVRRDLIHGLINDIDGISCIRPQGAFYILCDISSFGLSAADFCKRLLEEKKVAAIPCEAFSAPGNIRLSYACSEANIREAINRIKDFCASL
ncbi:MAG: pyridoxal phosphate-dependent aminotransferase [Lentisphaerae bacterium]|nr:pyridoxal phosphate-dependent aminotransferase [Lentisphaerota bacterium]MCP4100927.1 pyridoxal phosphate-dependent aminotransferase [Lentisphaerota bacterium]